MIKDKRKSVRRPMRYTAWVLLEGDEQHGCSLSDISVTGARLDIDDLRLHLDVAVRHMHHLINHFQIGQRTGILTGLRGERRPERHHLWRP